MSMSFSARRSRAFRNRPNARSWGASNRQRRQRSVSDRELLDRAVRYLAASLVATDDAQCHLLADIAWTAMFDLAKRRSHTSGDVVSRNAFEAVRTDVLAVV